MKSKAFHLSTYAWGKLKRESGVLSLFLAVSFVGLHSQGVSTKAGSRLLATADSLYFKNEWQNAKNKYLAFLKDSPEHKLVWLRLGYCNHNLSEYDDAIRDYNKALENNPPAMMKITAESRLARVYAIQNKNDLAFVHLDSAIRNGYGNLGELDTLVDFSGLKKDQRFASFYARAYDVAYPCHADSKAREFDFWVGEWNVYSNVNKNLVGYSRIEKISGDCAILENYKSVQTSYNGKSINNYDGTKGCWEQMWVGSSGVELPGPDVQRFVDGHYKDSAMRFTFETTVQGKKAIGNFIFYNLGPDKVRQYQETSIDGGQTYQVGYDLLYLRRK